MIVILRLEGAGVALARDDDDVGRRLRRQRAGALRAGAEHVQGAVVAPYYYYYYYYYYCISMYYFTMYYY